MRLSDTGRGRPLDFTFDGAPIAAVEGDTVASALAAAGIVRLRRPPGDNAAMRGVWCGMGACFDCLVTVNGRASQRACLAKIEGGDEVRSTMPDGAAGDPLAPLSAPPTSPRMPERQVDVLVVGAGPAGLSAALAARGYGVSVIVLDERALSGGQYYKQLAGGSAPPADRQGRAGARLIDAARAAGVELIQDAHVFGAFAADDVVALIDGTAHQLRPKRLILATGAYERPMPFPGWTLPGVMTTGAAQTLERAYDVAPGRRVVIAGNGPLNFQLAASLVAKGVEVAAVVEASPRPRARDCQAALQATMAAPDLIATGLGYLWRLRCAGVPVLWGHVAIAAHGDGSVSAIDLAPIDDAGRPRSATTTTIACDTLCLGYGFIASVEIARALGCRMQIDERHLGTAAVATDGDGRTSIATVFAVGDGARIAGARVAQERGHLAGDAAARGLAGGSADERDALRETGQARRRLARAETFQKALWQLFPAPPTRLDGVPDPTILCRCESLTFGQLRAELAAGWTSLD